MKITRIVLLSVTFLAVGPGLFLSRAWCGGRSSTSQHEAVTEDNRGDMPKAKGEQEAPFAAAAGPVTLGADETRVIVGTSQPGEPLSRTLKSLAGSRAIYLVIADLKAAEQPAVPYNIYFDMPRGTKADLNSPNYVGTINFFNAVRLEGADPNSKDARFFSFDITDIVRKLQAKGLLKDETTITIKPGGVPAPGAQAQIGRIELVAH